MKERAAGTSIAAHETRNWTIALVGQPSAVSRAFGQVFQKSRISIHPIEFNGVVTQTELHRIENEIKKHKPFLLLAESQVAWNALRVLNVWQSEGSMFDSAKSNSRTAPKVVPISGISDSCFASLFDYFAAGIPSFGSWIAGLVQALHDRSASPALEPKEVRCALLHFLAAQERHDLRLKNKPDPHGRNDVIASVRILQGAKLDGWITSDMVQDSCQRIFTIARENDLLSVSPDWSSSRFVELSPEPAPTERTDSESFASLLVADDQGFWGKPLQPIWQRLGFELVPQTTAVELENEISVQKDKGKPVRVILLDMRLNNDNLGGAKLLRYLRRRAGHIPVVALSVDDQFSETVLLKRMGVFAYLNKHALAEPNRGRDTLSAFRQMMDAVLAAAFASLADDFWQLWRSIAQECGVLIEAEPRLGKTEIIQLRQAKDSLSDLEKQIRASFDIFREECRRMFHGFWQDSAPSSGLACRQIIRAVGLINDKWCSLWKSWRFDPDRDDGYWAIGTNVEFPYLAYHKITTAIRGEASHAMLEDPDFEWRDVWIAFLTLFLKIEGTAGTFLKVDGIRYWKSDHNRQIGVIVTALRQLLKARGIIGDHSRTEQSSEKLRENLATSSQHLDARLKAYLQFPFAEDGFVEGDNRRLTVQTYLDRKRNYYPVMDGFANKWRGATSFSQEQLQAHLLLLEIIAERVPTRARD